MAKKRLALEFIDIVMGAEAETIKKAYEARMQIDDQLALREEAYRRIAELETQVEEIVGQKGEFIFPAPPLPVAGYSRLIPASRPAPKPYRAPEIKVAAVEEKKTEETGRKTPATDVEKETKEQTPAAKKTDKTSKSGN